MRTRRPGRLGAGVIAMIGMVTVGGDRAVGGAEFRPPSRRSMTPGAVDTHSWGNPQQVRVRHVLMELIVDFEERRLSGVATLDLERSPDCPENAALWLDTRDLEIEAVEAEAAGGRFVEVAYRKEVPEVPEDERRLFPAGERSDGEPIHGTPLVVAIGGADRVRIRYRTSPGASALQWLTPEQTAGGEHPFLFSQSQAIHARSWVPLQDSPGVRVSYDATVQVPTGLKAVMSASGNFQENDAEGPFRFEMDRPVPPYLIAIAVGDLTFRPLGPRTGVYAEPAMIDRAAREFEDTEAMIETTERRYGPYRWGRYDLLVLPPSFPFGGMENPRLTFVTPTILAGDKSLVALIAHELAHSWSGNLVTNATWRDFWLNEGFTTYIEGRIVEDVYGADRAAMEAVLGLRDLRDDLNRLDDRDEVLHIDLWGRDPDDNVTAVPYEKGKFFLRSLERAFGRDRFDAFLRGYFDHFAFQSITTDQFKHYLIEHLFKPHPAVAATIDLRSWIDTPGLPPIDEPTSDRLAAVDRQADAWLSGSVPAKDLKVDDWSTQEWLFFLDALPEALPVSRVHELDMALMVPRAQNAEITCRWLELVIRSGYGEADSRLVRFLTSVGRRKFLMPLYRALAATEEGKQRAKAIYAMARPLYHPIAVESIDRLLGDQEPSQHP